MPNFFPPASIRSFPCWTGLPIYPTSIKGRQRTRCPIAITDHGNMFGAFKFVAESFQTQHERTSGYDKPIVGCRFYVVESPNNSSPKTTTTSVFISSCWRRMRKGTEPGSSCVHSGLASKVVGKYPIDKELVLKYHKGLIATTCCLGALVPRTILRKGEAEGEKEFKWWLDLFGERLLHRTSTTRYSEQHKANEVLLRWAVKYGVKVIASERFPLYRSRRLQCP